jgi:hypothetical protein
MSISNLAELVISLILEIWLVALLFKRGVRRHFPVFFVFTLYTALLTFARLITISDYRAYFYVYWWTESLFAILSLAALHEVVREPAAAHHGNVPRARSGARNGAGRASLLQRHHRTSQGRHALALQPGFEYLSADRSEFGSP